MRSQRPSRQSACDTHEAGGRLEHERRLLGSVIGTIPVSSSTVAVLIVFEPDIPSYEHDSMIRKPASASGCADGSTTSSDSGADPRGSKSSSRRSSSPSRSRWRIFSSIVVPGTSSTPPTTIRLGSPSAWASTQCRTRPRTPPTLPEELSEGFLQIARLHR